MAAMELAAKKETLSQPEVCWGEGVFSLAAVSAEPARPENRVWEKPQLAKNSRLGFAAVGSTLRLGFVQVNSRTALGMRGTLYDEGVGSRCNGKERDEEDGNYYYGARYYASYMGRFMTPDWAGKPTAVPYANFGNPQSLNLYSYAENNPTTLGDLDGHCGAGLDLSCNTADNAPGASGEDPDSRTDVGYYEQRIHNGGSEADAEGEYEQDQVNEFLAAGLSLDQIYMPNGHWASGASAAGFDPNPSKLDVDYSKTENKGSYSNFYYKVENANGQQLMFGGMQAKEHVSVVHDYGASGTLHQNSDFEPVAGGYIKDQVGLGKAPKTDIGFMDFLVSQTFTIKYGAVEHNLGSVLEHQTLIVNGAISNYSWSVWP